MLKKKNRCCTFVFLFLPMISSQSSYFFISSSSTVFVALHFLVLFVSSRASVEPIAVDDLVFHLVFVFVRITLKALVLEILGSSFIGSGFVEICEFMSIDVDCVCKLVWGGKLIWVSTAIVWQRRKKKFCRGKYNEKAGTIVKFWRLSLRWKLNFNLP